jgi:ribulose-5-phosphate 4-epimerase/fuculose-1-phosphate aldolase
MRVGKVKLLPYVRPGDAKAGEMIGALEGRYGAVLLANHGPVVTGKTIFDAVYAAEELEETAKLLMLLRGMKRRVLTADQVGDLLTVYG